MIDMIIAVLSGFLFGISFSLALLPKLVSREIKQEQFQANLNLYRQLLFKKQDRGYQYSQEIRKVINAVHVALLVEHNNKSVGQEPKSPTRCDPCI